MEIVITKVLTVYALKIVAKMKTAKAADITVVMTTAKNIMIMITMMAIGTNHGDNNGCSNDRSDGNVDVIVVGVRHNALDYKAGGIGLCT
eukprot:5577646-Ditylum_brightwellii.AAC.1